MTRAFKPEEMWRWLVAVAAVTVVIFGTLYLRLLLLLFYPFLKDLAQPTAGFLMSSLIVLAGSLLAPQHRLVTAIVLFVLATFLGPFLLYFHLMGTGVGGLVAVGLVTWWFSPRHTARSAFWIGGAACAALAVFVGLVHARYVDRPAHPEPLPYQLTFALGPAASRVTAFYRYNLGGVFISSEGLCRIDAKPDVIAALVHGLGLQSTNAVPQRFWHMPPYYWPRSMSAGAQAFQSPAFSAEGLGPMGTSYFLLHDRAQERAFVWCKSAF